MELRKYKYRVDELNNRVPNGSELFRKVKGKYTPWSASQVQLEGRDITQTNQQYLIPSDLITVDEARSCNIVMIDGRERKITQVTDWTPRWIRFVVEAYKS